MVSGAFWWTKKLLDSVDLSTFLTVLRSHLTGLNRRPQPYHGCALPTELKRHSYLIHDIE